RERACSPSSPPASARGAPSPRPLTACMPRHSRCILAARRLLLGRNRDRRLLGGGLALRGARRSLGLSGGRRGGLGLRCSRLLGRAACRLGLHLGGPYLQLALGDRVG